MGLTLVHHRYQRCPIHTTFFPRSSFHRRLPSSLHGLRLDSIAFA
ncbi:MAG: hypothetical protein OJF52_002077 [Nitrospira sp.]|nr:MAG: hypothetical protein OJF52_002077 [Nitrospira sp.]